MIEKIERTPQHFKSIEVKGYKSPRFGFSLNNLKSVNIINGQAGSGKSNILEAIIMGTESVPHYDFDGFMFATRGVFPVKYRDFFDLFTKRQPTRETGTHQPDPITFRLLTKELDYYQTVTYLDKLNYPIEIGFERRIKYGDGRDYDNFVELRERFGRKPCGLQTDCDITGVNMPIPKIGFAAGTNIFDGGERETLRGRNVLKKLTKMMTHIYPGIVEIRYESGRPYVYSLNMNTPHHANALGSTFLRLLNVLATVLVTKDMDAIVVDDLFANMDPVNINKYLVHALIPALKEKDVQLITTMNLEEEFIDMNAEVVITDIRAV